jgi:serine phosphatase RsbU (regulator of sigma subunit)/anti-sigma regulatory factor (Ser/Thr protein kinase)
MSARTGSLPPPPGLADEGARALLDALEQAPSAMLCLASATAAPIWANARGRALRELLDGQVAVGGRPVAEVVDEVLRTRRPVTLTGGPGPEGRTSTLVARPLEVAGEPAVLLVLEVEAAAGEAPERLRVVDLVDQAQLSLLPPYLPLLPDVELSSSYHRASSSRSAGGDWYDAVPLGGGRLALVIGDAVGHGVPAAGAMSRLRGALRSTVLHSPAPEDVLPALDAFAAQMDDVEGASVFYGVLDAASGRLSYTAAGHPAPFVVHADGRTSVLPVVPRPPLGSLPGTEAPVSQVQLEQGSTLVLFSNGAVTGGGPAPAWTLDRLADVAREVLSRSAPLDGDDGAGLADAIAEGVLRPEGRPDDVAVLVAHRRATGIAPLHLDLRAVPAALPGVRRRLGEWLAALGMSEQDRVGVMVAVGEACANAAEHAYRGTEPGPLSVVADVDVDGVLTVTVADQGTWRPPDRDPGDRGRGLLIMRQLVDTVLLQGEQGTTLTLRLRLRRTVEDDPGGSTGLAGAQVVVDRDAELPVVRVSGVADEGAAEQLRIRVLEASRGGTTPIELDVTDAGLFSSAAVREVLALARIARAEGWRLVVRARAGGVTRHVLEISGLADLVDLR